MILYDIRIKINCKGIFRNDLCRISTTPGMMCFGQRPLHGSSHTNELIPSSSSGLQPQLHLQLRPLSAVVLPVLFALFRAERSSNALK